MYSFALAISCSAPGTVYLSPACFPVRGVGRVSYQRLSATKEDAREDFEYYAAKDDKSEEAYVFVVHAIVSKTRRESRGGSPGESIPSQTGEMGDLGVSLFLFLSSSLDLPRRASWSRANLRFARRCWGVCACMEETSSLHPRLANYTHEYCFALWINTCERRSQRDRGGWKGFRAVGGFWFRDSTRLGSERTLCICACATD